MKIKFVHPHKSFNANEEFEIPNFSVITGTNGSGKSQLLQAITMRYAVVDGKNDDSITLFEPNSFRLQNETTTNGPAISSMRDQAYYHITHQIQTNSHAVQVSKIAKHMFSPEEYEILRADLTEKGGSFINYVKEKLPAAESSVEKEYGLDMIRNNTHLGGLYSLIMKLPFAFCDLTKKDFDIYYQPKMASGDFLPAFLSHIIWDYYSKLANNRLNDYHTNKYGKDFPFLTEENFEKVHGPKPWDVINEIISRFSGLRYRINSPEGQDFSRNYVLQLVSLDSPGLELGFDALSSGEQTLMALVGALYKKNLGEPFPNILLLDELDASLHPSMIVNLIEVIQTVFVSRGMKVILVTHSPSTVALAPVESLCIVNRSENPRIKKTTRKEALAILTEGFATLDDGILLLKELTRHRISIITEGHNAALLDMAFKQRKLDDVSVVRGLEGKSGKTQLATLFDFFTQIDHKNIVVFIVDCDVNINRPDTLNTKWIRIEKNQLNKIASSGIENAFDPELLEEFTVTIVKTKASQPQAVTIKSFDEDRKKDFAQKIIDRNNPTDFEWVDPIVDLIEIFKKQ